MTPVSFRVYGDPIPQPRPRVSTFGGHARAYVPAAHPIHAFREAVRLGAIAAGVPLVSGPVLVSVLAVFARPASHRKADGSLRAGAPLFPGHRCGDADNLAKGVLDSLHGVAFEDDDQADLGFVRRRYGKTAFVEVSVSEFEPEDHGEGL
jgi:Holliday junction resolvase RusA-like endonuclease